MPPKPFAFDFSKPAAFSAGAVTAGAPTAPAPAPVLQKAPPAFSQAKLPMRQPVGGGFIPTVPGMGARTPTVPEVSTAAVTPASPSVVLDPDAGLSQAERAQKRMNEKLSALGVASALAPDSSGNAAEELLLHGAEKPLNLLRDPQALRNFRPQRGLLKCYVLRNKGDDGVTFKMFLERGDVFILAAQKRAGKPTSNFALSQSQVVGVGGEDFLGKVRANFSGTEFVFYDNGTSPDPTRRVAVSSAPVRCELGAVLFDSTVSSGSSTRFLRVVLPRLLPAAGVGDSTAKEVVPQIFQPQNAEESILKLSVAQPDMFDWLVSKEPEWNESIRAYQLNFHGRVKLASTKNCQLVQYGAVPPKVVFQMGKFDADRFAVDFQYPLTAQLAMCIALSQFDDKLAVA